MSSAQALQELLRFLTQDAKLPLATAMRKVAPLQQAALDTAEKLASGKDPAALTAIFDNDEKQAKQILSAAKRSIKKKKRPSASDDAAPSGPSAKRSKKTQDGLSSPPPPAELEASLALPVIDDADCDEAALKRTVLVTNRAPLMLAFVLTLLRFARPRQPLSSRLSLAQGYVAVTSRARAAALGIEAGATAEEEGFGEGRPVVRILGKEVRVLRRWGYEWEEGEGAQGRAGDEDEGIRSSVSGHGDEGVARGEQQASDLSPDHAAAHPTAPIQEAVDDDEPALWALDLEALKKTNQRDPRSVTSTAARRTIHPTGLPIHTPQSARAYLLKAFDSVDSSAATPAARTRERERNLALLLRSLELLYSSWADGAREAGDDVAAELQRRTWGWYVRVRPEVADGAAGWGGKGEVALKEMLALRKGQIQG